MILGVVEILDRDGSARRVVPVNAWPVSIGRALDNDVVLDDPHVSAHHATVTQSEGGLMLTAGESVNGVQLSRRDLKTGASEQLPSGESFQIGATRLRLRLSTDTLAAERPLHKPSPTGRIPLPLLLGLLFGSLFASEWAGANPGRPLTGYLTSMVGLVILLLIWCGLWALVSKLFRGRFEFWPHTRIAARYLLALELASVVMSVLAFMLAVPILSRTEGLVSAALGCAMIAAHLLRLIPSRRRAVAITMGSIYAAGVLLMGFATYKTHDRIFDELFVPVLGPPSLRLAPAVPTDTFLAEARRLKSAVDAHVDDDDAPEFSLR